MDYGHAQTDKMLQMLLNKINTNYNSAQKYVKKKAKDALKKFEKADKEQMKLLKKGLITHSEYIEWRSKTIMSSSALLNLSDTLSLDLSNANQIATSLINGKMPDVFALNANYGTYEIDSLLGLEVSESFALYDHDTVVRLMRKNPEVVPKASVNIPKDKVWNRRKIYSALSQGILAGDSIPHIADRLQKVTDMNRRSAIRNARTYTTAAENGGRVDSYKRAKDMGIDVKQEWMATLDLRTRSSHRHLDGEKIVVGEKFSNGLRYPGDPEGKPEEIYNCRCTLVAFDPMFEKEDEEMMKHRFSRLPEGMSYEEWKGLKIENEDFATKIKKIASEATDIDEDTIKKAGKVLADAFDKEYYGPLKKELEEAQRIHDERRIIAKEVEEYEDKVSKARFVTHGLDTPEEQGFKSIQEAELFIKENEKKLEQLKKSKEYKEYMQSVLDLAEKKLKLEDYEASAAWLRNKIGLVRSVGVSDLNVKQHLRSSRSPMRKHVEYAYDHYPTEWVTRSVNRGKLTVRKTDRGYYNGFLNEIAISGYFDKDYRETAFHELGHRFEDVIPGLKRHEREFFQRRTAGEEQQWLGFPYAKSEKTRKDNFLDKYMGKEYGDGSYELVSMGFEYAFTDPARLAQDKDMQEWILGILLLV